MVHRILSMLLTVVIFVLSSSSFLTRTEASINSENKLNSVGMTSQDLLPDAEMVLKTRFLNMLNHNFVYDDAFSTVEGVVNNSVLALLSQRDKTDDNYIALDCVSGFVYNMYGVTIDKPNEINSSFPNKDGFIYIIPRGYTEYSHEIMSVALNEDGSYTVTSSVAIQCHDSGSKTRTAVSLFVKNDKSSFGYNIIYSNISDNVLTA